MLKSRSKTDKGIVEEIKAMNFDDKCQARLDHKTCLYLSGNGYKQNRQIKLRHGKDIPALKTMLHLSAEWIRFFLERSLDWWDKYIPESHFDLWVKHRFFSPEPHYAGDNWWKN